MQRKGQKELKISIFKVIKRDETAKELEERLKDQNIEQKKVKKKGNGVPIKIDEGKSKVILNNSPSLMMLIKRSQNREEIEN